MIDEEYVRSKWEELSESMIDEFEGSVIIGDCLLFIGPQRWDDAAEYTRQYGEAIRRVEQEIKLVLIIMETDWVRCEWLADCERILAREQAALAELKKGWKE